MLGCCGADFQSTQIRMNLDIQAIFLVHLGSRFQESRAVHFLLDILGTLQLIVQHLVDEDIAKIFLCPVIVHRDSDSDVAQPTAR